MNQLYARFDARVGVCSDSRNLASGQIFFALRGANFNGNLFAAKALELGASCVVVDELIPELNEKDPRVFLVPDALEALQDLARLHRRQWGKHVVALTGSNGKTTAKELFASVLRERYNVLATDGNLNNHIGVPLTLLRLQPEHDLAVVELGANHQGEIAALARICEPNIGYVTNFGLAHLEGFGGPDGVVRGKSELYRHLRDHAGTTLVYEADIRQMQESFAPRLAFGSEFTFAANEVGALRVSWGSSFAQSHLIGEFHDRALGAAVTLGIHLGVPDASIVRGIERYEPKNNRGEWRSIGRYRVFMDAYNANPSSMEASLRTTASRHDPDSIIYVAGDLFELGAYSHKGHQDMVDVMVELGITQAILVGSEFALTKHSYDSVTRTEDLMARWRSKPPAVGTIWIKGSRGMALERLADVLSQA